MSLAEILAELPKLDDVELESVIQRGLELRKEPAFQASPELLQAIDEALAIPEDQCVSIEEACRIVKSWNTK